MIEVPASPIFYWVAFLTLVGFAEMGVDKLLAVWRRSRVSEGTLWATSLLGGVLGIVAGGFGLPPQDVKGRVLGARHRGGDTVGGVRNLPRQA